MIVVGQVIYHQAGTKMEKMSHNRRGFAQRVGYLSARKHLPDNTNRRLSVLLVVKSSVMTCNKYASTQPLLDIYLLLTQQKGSSTKPIFINL